MIYLDYAASTPIREEALQAFIEASRDYYGNPSSPHDVGGKAKSLLDGCRKELANLLNINPDDLFFTSGGSESNNMAIRSILEAHKHKGKHVITSSTEHSSINNLFKQLGREGYDVTFLPVDKHGRVSVKDAEACITNETIFASIQHGNSEIGTIQPIEELGKLFKKHNVVFHSDCVQTFGKLPINLKNIDSISISGHKIYGPKGVGACYINSRVKWNTLIPGTSHESGFRPGTVNVPGIASLATAAKLIYKEMPANAEKFAQLRNRLIEGLKTINHKFNVQGHPTHQLSHIIGLTVSGFEGHYVMLEFNRKNIAISTGSACQSQEETPAGAMIAMGKSPEEAKEYIRLSLGRLTTPEDIDKVIEVLRKTVEKK